MLSPGALSKANLSEIEDMIRPSGFYKQKARYVRALARHIVERYHGQMAGMLRRPMHELRRELLDIRGIGPETADSILLFALGLPSFVVDAYTLRLLARLGTNLGRDYDATKRLFERALGRDVKALSDMHALIVIHCKEQCMKSPRCGECYLRARCPSKRE
jgi:endonuclease-3 related protein